MWLQGSELSLNQNLRSLSLESAMGMGGMAPTMGLSNGPGPVDMSHVRPDPQTSFSPQSSFNQGFMGTPDWSASSLVMSNAPGPYTNNNSFDLDMWVSDTAPEP